MIVYFDQSDRLRLVNALAAMKAEHGIPKEDQFLFSQFRDMLGSGHGVRIPQLDRNWKRDEKP